MHEELNKIKELCTDKEDQFKALNKLPILTEKKKTEILKDINLELKENKQFESFDQRLLNLTEKFHHKEEKKYKIVKKVTLDDIQKTVYELKLRFILKKIEMNSIEKVYWNFIKLLF